MLSIPEMISHPTSSSNSTVAAVEKWVLPVSFLAHFTMRANKNGMGDRAQETTTSFLSPSVHPILLSEPKTLPIDSFANPHSRLMLINGSVMKNTILEHGALLWTSVKFSELYGC